MSQANTPPTPPPLADGQYDVIIIDATPTEGGQVSIEVAVTAGAAKGHVVGLLASTDLAVGMTDPLDLLGLPGVVTVVASEPRLTLS